MALALVLCSFHVSTVALFSQQFDWQVLDSIETTVYYSIMDLDCATTLDCAYIADSGGWRSVAHVTDDGGITWRTILRDDVRFEDSHFPLRYLDVSYPGENTIVVLVEESIILASHDGGATWDTTVFDHPRGSLHSLDFSNESLGYVAGPRHWSYMTLGGGVTWVRTDSVVDDMSIMSVHASSRGDAVLLLGRNEIRRIAISNDSGRTWSVRSAPHYINDLTFHDGNLGWGVGGVKTGVLDTELDLIVRTSDGGTSWIEELREWNDPAGGLRNLSFSDSLNGVATGGRGKIFRTYDGGLKWERQFFQCDTLTSTCGLGVVDLVSPDVAFAIGPYARILKYERTSGVHEGLTQAMSSGSLPVQVVSAGGSVAFDITDTNATLSIVVYGISGRAILAEQIYPGKSYVHVPSTLAPGLYFAALSSGEYVRLLVRP